MKSRGPYRRHSTPFKLQLCQDIRNGVIGRRDAQRTYGVSANLIQLWLTQFDRGDLNDEEAEASVIAEYEAQIAALERKVGQLTMELDLVKKTPRSGGCRLTAYAGGKGKDVGPERLNDQEVARLVKKTALAAGVRGELSEVERGQMFAGHSLRAGLASSAEVDERYVQKQLGHASAEMTRRYQRRRDRFRINLTKAAGL